MPVRQQRRVPPFGLCHTFSQYRAISCGLPLVLQPLSVADSKYHQCDSWNERLRNSISASISEYLPCLAALATCFDIFSIVFCGLCQSVTTCVRFALITDISSPSAPKRFCHANSFVRSIPIQDSYGFRLKEMGQHLIVHLIQVDSLLVVCKKHIACLELRYKGN